MKVTWMGRGILQGTKVARVQTTTVETGNGSCSGVDAASVEILLAGVSGHRCGRGERWKRKGKQGKRVGERENGLLAEGKTGFDWREVTCATGGVNSDMRRSRSNLVSTTASQSVRSDPRRDLQDVSHEKEGGKEGRMVGRREGMCKRKEVVGGERLEVLGEWLFGVWEKEDACALPFWVPGRCSVLFREVKATWPLSGFERISHMTSQLPLGVSDGHTARENMSCGGAQSWQRGYGPACRAQGQWR